MKNFTLFIALAFLSGVVQAQLSLVKNINLSSDNQATGGIPSNFLKVGSTLYFAAKGEYGIELYKSNGTPQGTTLIKNIRPGTANSSPHEFVESGGLVYFVANDGFHGDEVWRTDGTPEGTFMLNDLAYHSNLGYPQSLTALNGKLYFLELFNSPYYHLYVTDGTTAGTKMVTDNIVYPDGNGNLCSFNGYLYFHGTSSQGGTELYKTDGQFRSITLVKDIYPGTGSSSPRHFTVSGNTLYFTADDGVHGKELWKTDGTTAGTSIVSDLTPGSTSSTFKDFEDVNGQLYFVTTEGTGTLYKTNGTAQGTMAVKTDIFKRFVQTPNLLTNVNGTLFFKADNTVNGFEYYKTDGTPEGTIKITSTNTTGDGPGPLALLNGQLYFSSFASAYGVELWTSDGTAAGTHLLKDIFPGSSSASPTGITEFNGKLFFSASDRLYNNELWTSDGTDSGTQLFLDFLGGDKGSDPQDLFNYNGTLLFSAIDSNTGRELWKSDGTSEGTVLIKDIGVGDSSPRNFTLANGVVFFSADSDNGRELWRTDGTTPGTFQVKDIAPGVSSGYPVTLTSAGDIVYFVASDHLTGNELWRSDGTAEGTYLVKDIAPGSSNGMDLNSMMLFANGTLYFMANNGATGYELWKTDGTEAGTVMIKDIQAGSTGSTPYDFTAANGLVFFHATTSANGKEVWVTDGTTNGTFMLKDVKPGAQGSINIGTYAHVLHAIGNKVLFIADDGTHGSELWMSDGTVNGTVLLKDLYPGSGSSIVNDQSFLGVAGAFGYFVASTDVLTLELFVTDGTAANTKLLKDIVPGELPFIPSFLAAVTDQSIYFMSAGESELWRSDGRECKTRPLASNTTATFSAPYGQICRAADKIFILGNSIEHGIEIYVYNTSNDPPGNCNDPQTITFDPVDKKTYGDGPFELHATASSGLPVTFSASDPTLVRIEGSQISILKAGSVNIVAAQPGNPDFAAAPDAARALVINKDTLLVRADNQSRVAGATNPPLTFSYTGFDYTDTNQKIDEPPIASTSATVGSPPGVYPITLSGGSDDSYVLTLVNGSLTVTGAAPVVYLTSPANNAVNVLPSASFVAKTVTGATTYTIELNTMSDFSGESIVKTGARSQSFSTLAYNTTYYARVKTNLSDVYGQVTNFTTAPSEFFAYLTSPANNSTGQYVSVAAMANAVNGASTYTIEFNTSPNFDGTQFVYTGGRSHTFSALTYNTVYYTRVKTDLSDNWGKTRSFTTGDPTSFAYMTAPVSGSSTLTNLSITSHAVDGATTYSFEVSPLADFSANVVSRSGARTQSFSNLMFSTTYYVRIKTELSQDWGPVKNFTTKSPVASAYVTTPADGSRASWDLTVVTVDVGATEYYLDVASTPDFSGNVYNFVSATNKFAVRVYDYNTKFYTRVSTNLAVGEYGPVKTFTTYTPTTSAYLTSPANGATNVRYNITLQTNAIKDAQAYYFELNTASDFSNVPMNLVSATEKADAYLNFNTTYYVRVKTDLLNEWGKISSFTTGDPASLTFIKLPADGTTGLTTSVSVTVNAVSGADTYTIEVNTASDFSGVSQVKTGLRTIRFSGLSTGTTYYVRAHTNLSPVWGPTSRFATSVAGRMAMNEEGDQATNEFKVHASPNPFSGKLKVMILAKDPYAILALRDLSGKIVLETIVPTNQESLIDSELLGPGMYLLHAATPSHQEWLKVIKE